MERSRACRVAQSLRWSEAFSRHLRGPLSAPSSPLWGTSHRGPEIATGCSLVTTPSNFLRGVAALPVVATPEPPEKQGRCRLRSPWSVVAGAKALDAAELRSRRGRPHTPARDYVTGARGRCAAAVRAARGVCPLLALHHHPRTPWRNPLDFVAVPPSDLVARRSFVASSGQRAPSSGRTAGCATRTPRGW